MINWHKRFSIFILILFLLAGCASPKMEEDKHEDNQVYMEWINNRDPETDTCGAIKSGKAPDVTFVYVYEDPDKEGEWQRVTYFIKDAEKYAAKGTKVYISFDRWNRWTNDNIQAVRVEYNPEYFDSSAEWNKEDNYCFDDKGNIIEIYSYLDLYDDNLRLVRAWTFNKDGSVRNQIKTLTDPYLGKTFDPNRFDPSTDKPPYLATSYQDLLEHFGLSDQMNKVPKVEMNNLTQNIEDLIKTDFPVSEYLPFVSDDKKLTFYYRPDWICKGTSSDFRIDVRCYPKSRIEGKQEYGFSQEIDFPEVKIVSNQCQLGSEHKIGSVILNTSDFEGPKYNTFYKKYNTCEVSVSAYSEIDTEEELSKIITESK
ncbi:hypothetical protein KKA33_03510 [Patescibacteria group bacterium]|nr:hypothetical protein [Patescibacteria group bacterium]